MGVLPPGSVQSLPYLRLVDDVILRSFCSFTKTMLVDANRETREAFRLDDDELEEVDSFAYLGSTMNSKGDSTEEIKQ